MKPIANTVFDFLKEKEQTASEPFFGAEVLPSLQHPVSKLRTVRVDNVSDSNPLPIASGEICRFNARLAIEILVKPASEKLEHLLEARAAATEIVEQISKLIFENQKLGASDCSICDVNIQNVRDFWGNIQTKKYALSYIFLVINKL